MVLVVAILNLAQIPRSRGTRTLGERPAGIGCVPADLREFFAVIADPTEPLTTSKEQVTFYSFRHREHQTPLGGVFITQHEVAMSAIA